MMQSDFSWTRRTLARSAVAVLALAGMPWAAVAAEVPDVFIGRLSNEVLDAVRKDPAIKAGDVRKIVTLVDRSSCRTSISSA